MPTAVEADSHNKPRIEPVHPMPITMIDQRLSDNLMDYSSPDISANR